MISKAKHAKETKIYFFIKCTLIICQVSLLVVEDLPRDITLGLDTLKQHRFFIDFDREEVLIGRYGRVKFAIGKPIQLHKRSGKQRTQSPTRLLTKVSLATIFPINKIK